MKGLSKAKARILRLLWENGRSITARDLTEQMNLGSRSASAHLRGLTRAGFIVRTNQGYTLPETGKALMGARHVSTPFHFYAGLGEPLGIRVQNLFDFCETIATIDVRSLEFHLRRGDFAAWIDDPDRKRTLRTLRASNLTGETLRAQLCVAFQPRYGLAR